MELDDEEIDFIVEHCGADRDQLRQDLAECSDRVVAVVKELVRQLTAEELGHRGFF